MSDTRSPITLNAHQRRHFEVLFARLEESLARIENLLAGDGVMHRAVSRIDNDLPTGFREHAKPVLDIVGKQISEIATRLALSPRVVSSRRAIAATLSSEAIRIEDSLSHQLRGYGAVDPSVARHLDPILKDLASLLSELASALASKTRPSRHR
jgi:hypothetical protein